MYDVDMKFTMTKEGGGQNPKKNVSFNSDHDLRIKQWS